MKYKLIQKKWGVAVYKNKNVMALIDESFAIKLGYKTAMEYCLAVFMEVGN